jgi:hypothetical protein
VNSKIFILVNLFKVPKIKLKSSPGERRFLNLIGAEETGQSSINWSNLARGINTPK